MGHLVVCCGSTAVAHAGSGAGTSRGVGDSIQVNGKTPITGDSAPDVSEDDLLAAALADERVRALTDGHEVVKVIVVPRRLVNVVIR